MMTRLRMAGLLLALGCVQLGCVSAPAAHVFFDLRDHVDDAATNRTVIMLPITAPKGASGRVYLGDPKRYSSGVTGTFYASNCVAMGYLVRVMSPPLQTTFEITVPATNGVVNAATILSTGTNNVAEGRYAWSISSSYNRTQVDAKIAAASFGSNGGAAVTVSGALTATTNGGVVTIRTAGVVTNFSNGMSGGESEVWTMIPKTLFIYPGAMTNDGLAVRVEHYGQSAALYSAGVLSNMEEVGRFSFNDDGIMSWLHNFDGAHIAPSSLNYASFDAGTLAWISSATEGVTENDLESAVFDLHADLVGQISTASNAVHALSVAGTNDINTALVARIVAATNQFNGTNLLGGSVNSNKFDAVTRAWIVSATEGVSLDDLNVSSNALSGQINTVNATLITRLAGATNGVLRNSGWQTNDTGMVVPIVLGQFGVFGAGVQLDGVNNYVFAHRFFGGFGGRDYGITNAAGRTIAQQITDAVAGGVDAITNNHAAAVTFSNDVTVASNLVVQGSSTFETLNVGELNVTNLGASIIDSTNIINGTISSNDIAAGTIGTNLLSQSAYNALVGGGGSGVTGITTNVAVLVPGDLTNTLQFYLGVLTNVVAGVVTNEEPEPPAFDYDDVQTFESALAGNWSETDADSRLSVADAAAKKNGTNGMSYAAAVTSEAYLKWDDASANDNVSVGFWFKSGEFENYAGLRRIVQLWNDGQGTVGYIAEGRNAGDNARQLLWSIGSGVVTLADNTWYYVTAQYTRNGTSQLAVYDEDLAQVGSTVNGTAPNFAVDEIQWKAADIASSTAVFWDDIYIDVTDATFPLGPQ